MKIDEKAPKDKPNDENLNSRKRRLKPFRPPEEVTLLQGQGLIKCGYCAKPVDLFSLKSVYLAKQAEDSSVFYMCQSKCSRSSQERTVFIDELLLSHIWERINNLPPPDNLSKSLDEALEISYKIKKVKDQRKEKLRELPTAGFNIDGLLEKIDKLEAKIKNLQEDIDDLRGLVPQQNILLKPIWALSQDEFLEQDLQWHRILISMLIYNIRFFNEFLVLRVMPFTDEEKETDTGWGKRLHLSLKYSRRNLNEIVEEAEAEKTPESDANEN